MNNLIYVRSPEADFRPEKYISNALLNKFRQNKDYLTVAIKAKQFTKLNSQSFFYDDDLLMESFIENVEKVKRIAKDGDVVFFADAWNPMIPALKMYFYTKDLNVKLTGILHSSTTVPGEFLEKAGNWALLLEAAIVDSCTTVYVATEYSKEMLSKNSYISKRGIENITVSGLPLPTPVQNGSIPDKNKDIVVFSHRWAEDKQPNLFIDLAMYANSVNSNIEFQVLHPVPLEKIDLYNKAENAGIKFIHCETKDIYWEHLSKAKIVISTAKLETFGYSIIDGLLVGAAPVVPDVACYPYMYNTDYIYQSNEGPSAIYEKCVQTLANYDANASIAKYIKPQYMPLIDGTLDVFNNSVSNLLKV